MLKEALNSITPEERKALIYAFDNHLEECIKLENDYFVGVNVNNIPNLQILETTGIWSYGRIK